MAGIAGQKFISLPAYEAMWEQVLELTPEYDPKILRRYAPASKEVYGEVNPVLVSDFIKALKLSSQDVLYDLGSGVGNVVLQVAAQTGCVAVGVEIRSELTSIGQALLKNYQTLLRRAHLLRGEVQLVCGDILSPEVDLSKATVVFLNNYCFPQHLEQSVLKKFKVGLKNGVRIITLKDFAPRFRPTSTRFVKSYCHLFKFPWLKCRSSPDAVSWTDKSVDYFIYQVDRNNLARQKAFKEAAKKGLRLSDNLVCSLKDGEIVVEAVAPPAAKGKGNESEENSDVEIGALMQAEFRGDSAKHLLHVLRGGHELTQMLKSLGCDTAKLEASNRRAGEKLKEAELNGDLDRADGARPRKTARKGQHSSRSSTASSASSSTSPAVVLVAADDSFEELMERFATWQAETRKKDSKRGRKVKLSKPDDQRETPVTLAALNDELKRWEKEVKLSKKRSTPHNVSASGGSEWKALTADFAKWKRQHDTRQHSHSPSSAPDDPKAGVAAAVEPVAEPSKSSSLWDQAPPTTGSTPVMEYSLPPGWVRKIRCEPGGRRRYKFISPTGRVFVSLKSAREHIDKERISRKCSGDTSDSSPATTPPPPPPRRYAKRRSEELRKLATAPNKKQREPKEEKEEEEKEEKLDDDDDGATSQDSNTSTEAKTNEEVEAGERRQGHHTPNNANGQLPEGWRRRKRGRYWTYTSPDGTLYRSRKQALLAVSGQSDVQIDSEEQQQQEESEKKGEEDENSKVGQAASDEGCVQTTTTPKKRRLARRSAPAALERKRKQDMQREVEAKEAQEERSREAWDTHEDRCDRANIRRRVSNPGRGSSSSSSRETDENVIIINGGEEEEEVEGKEEEEKKEAGEEEKRPQKRSRRQRELDRLRGWDQWREEEQKRKEELQRRIRERRSSSSTRSGDDN